MTIGSFVSVGIAAFATGYHVRSPARRRWPKRVVTLLCFSILLVEIAFAISAVKGYNTIKHEGKNTHYRDLCSIQGALLNWSTMVMISLLVWFHYIQNQMLCFRQHSLNLQKKEIHVLIFIGLFSLILTLLPLFTDHIGTRDDFYACSVRGGYFKVLYLLMLFALLIANYFCFRNARWLSQVAESLDNSDRPEMLLSLKRYRTMNIAILSGTGYLFIILLVNFMELKFNFQYGAPYFCFLISFDFLLLPVIFVAFVHGYSWIEYLDSMFVVSNNKILKPFRRRDQISTSSNNNLHDNLIQDLDTSLSSKWSDYDDYDYTNHNNNDDDNDYDNDDDETLSKQEFERTVSSSSSSTGNNRKLNEPLIINKL